MQVVDFLREYWQFISTGIIIIFLIIYMIIKKKPITEIFDNSVFSKVTELVVLAEQKYGKGHGVDKMKFVIDSMRSFNDIFDETAIRSIAEYILSTPQKKESVNEKVK